MTVATIPETYRDLFTKKAFAHLATVGRDGARRSTSTRTGIRSAGPAKSA